MSGWHHDNTKWTPKECVVCKTVFTPKTGVNKFCSTSCKGKWKYITGSGSTEQQYLKVSGNWYKYFQRLLQHKDRKGVLTVEHLLVLLQEQEYKCALSGEILSCRLEKGVKVSTNASIDRIEAGGSYSIENVQLVCASLNSFRSNTNLEEFIDWCKKVAKNCE